MQKPFSTIATLSTILMAAALPGAGCRASTSGAASPAAPGQSTESAGVDTAPETPGLEVVAAIDQGPGNITVTPAGQIVLSLHQFYEPAVPVVALGEDGALVPFATDAGLDTVLGLQADRDGVVWLLDNGMREGVPPRLVGWDPARESRIADIDLEAVAPANAFVNDLAVDKEHGAVYIADPAGGANAALIVVDLATGQARRVLEGHASVVPEDVDLVIDGTPVRIRTPEGQEIRPRVGVNPIATDTKNEWLYFGPMHGLSLYRVRTADLRDASLAPAALAERVERWADKPISDGISIDTAGNIYLGDLARNAVGVIDSERRYRILIADPRLSWPDAFSFGPDGSLYTVANQLHRTAALNAGTQTATPPYLVLRIQPLAPGVPGR